MEVVKIVAFGMTALLLGLLLKTYKSEWASFLTLAAGLMIAIYLLRYLLQLSQVLEVWEKYTEGVSEYMGVLWKALGISYLCEFSANVCKDSGNTLIASQIELCGKIAVMLLGMPVLWALLKTITGYVG